MRNETDEYGTIFYYNEKDQLHRDNGLPAIEDADGDKEWFVDGKHHRDGGLPAIEYADGGKSWWVNDKLHRDGGLPAVEYADGSKAWYVDGKRHRDNGLPAIEHADGSKQWWVNDQLHRDGGLPAVEHADGSKQWWVNGVEIGAEAKKMFATKKQEPEIPDAAWCKKRLKETEETNYNSLMNVIDNTIMRSATNGLTSCEIYIETYTHTELTKKIIDNLSRRGFTLNFRIVNFLTISWV